MASLEERNVDAGELGAELFFAVERYMSSQVIHKTGPK